MSYSLDLYQCTKCLEFSKHAYYWFNEDGVCLYCRSKQNLVKGPPGPEVPTFEFDSFSHQESSTCNKTAVSAPHILDSQADQVVRDADIEPSRLVMRHSALQELDTIRKEAERSEPPAQISSSSSRLWDLTRLHWEPILLALLAGCLSGSFMTILFLSAVM